MMPAPMVTACPECGLVLSGTCYHDGINRNAVEMLESRATELRAEMREHLAEKLAAYSDADPLAGIGLPTVAPLVPDLLADELLDYARRALAAAENLVDPPKGDGSQPSPPGVLPRPAGHYGAAARDWIASARDALEARRIADEPLTEGERHAAAQALADLRRHLGAALGQTKAAERQRDQLAAFMARMAGEFESADTDQAKRQAARLRRAIADVMQDDGGEE